MGFYQRHHEVHKLDHGTSQQRLSSREGLSEDRLKREKTTGQKKENCQMMISITEKNPTKCRDLEQLGFEAD